MQNMPLRGVCQSPNVPAVAYGMTSNSNGTTRVMTIRCQNTRSRVTILSRSRRSVGTTLAVSFVLAACASPPSDHNHRAGAPWQMQRGGATATMAASCVLVSAPQPFVTGVGLDHVRLRIHDDGLVSLQSEHDPFDLAVRDEMGVQVKGQTPVLAPRMGSSPKELTFSPQDSARLLDQLANGSWARIQVALVPRKEMLTAAYSLEGFEEALRSYRMCEVFRAKQQGESPAYTSTDR